MIVAIICHRECECWQGCRFSIALQDALKTLGHFVRVFETTHEFFCWEYDVASIRRFNADVIIAIGLRSLVYSLKSLRTPLILYNVDPVHSINRLKIQWQERFRIIGFEIGELYGVIDYSLGINREAMTELGVKNLTFAPLGYHELFRVKGDDAEEFDVALFFQAPPSRRKRKRYAMSHILSEFCRVIDFETHDWGIPHGVERTRKYLNTKIILNIHRNNDWNNFSCIRTIQLGFSNSICVVSETSNGVPDGLLSGEHWIETSYKLIPDVIRNLLDNAEQRQRIAQNGYDWVKSYRLVDNWREPMTLVSSWLAHDQ